MVKRKKSKGRRVSITYTVLIWTGIVLAIFGSVVAVFGIGEETPIEGSLENVTIRTTNIGLVILIVGALLAGIVAIRLPKEVVVFGGETESSFTEKLVRFIPMPSFVVSIIGIVLLVWSLFC